jgi:hypothetical protein
MMRCEFPFRRNTLTGNYNPDGNFIENADEEEIGTKMANMPYKPVPGAGEMLLIGGRDIKTSKSNRTIFSYKEDQLEWIEFAQFPSSRMGHQVISSKN